MNINTDNNIDSIIEEYVDSFRKLLIIMFKGKNKIDVYDKIYDKKNKYNYCNHTNYKGKPCKRMVKEKGDTCIFHKKKLDISNKNISLDEKDNLLDETNNPFNENLENVQKRNYEEKSDNFNEKDNLLKKINLENNKLICHNCKNILTTQKEIASNQCNYCNNFPSLLSRNKTLVKCKRCNNNTLNFNKICNNCITYDRTEYLRKCTNCKLNRVSLNKHLCNYCYKKSKRKIIIIK